MKIKKFCATLLCLALLLTTAAFAACGPEKKPVDPPAHEVTLSKIEITKKPTKTEYTVGETFDPAGMVVTATYSDNSTAAVTDYTYAPKGALAASDTQIAVTYQGKTAMQSITVKPEPAAPKKIEITAPPAKTEYYVGETFDPAGMVVTATYSDNSTAAVTGYAYAPDGELAAADTQITVTYKEQTATQDITVAEPPAPKKYIFEAEAAELGITNNKWNIRMGTFPVDNSPRGTGYLANWKGDGKGCKIIYNITSDADADAALGIAMARRVKYDIWIGRTEKGNKMFSSLTLSGESVPLPDDYFPKSPDAPDNTDWQEKEIATVHLSEGENVFEFTVDTDEMYWDYLTLTTTAKAEWTSESNAGHRYCDWKVTAMPDETQEGRMYRYCDTCCAKEEVTLPALTTDGAYDIRAERSATEMLSERKIYTYHSENGDLEFTVASAPATGTAIDNKIEAESAVISGNWDGGKLVRKNSVTVEENTIEMLELNNRKGSATYTVDASQAASVTLVMRLAPYNTNDIKVNNVLRLAVNNAPVGMEDLTLVQSPGDNWYAFDDFVVAAFDVEEGENTIVFDALGNSGYNFDYLLLRSAATITLKA